MEKREREEINGAAGLNRPREEDVPLTFGGKKRPIKRPTLQLPLREGEGRNFPVLWGGREERKKWDGAKKGIATF